MMWKHTTASHIQLLLFWKLLIFFQNKSRIADSSDNEFIVKNVFVFFCEISPKKKLLLISTLEHSLLIDCMRQLHQGTLCIGIYKWAQND